MKENVQARELKSTSYELFILLLSCLSIANLLFLVIPGTDPVLRNVVGAIDVLITVIFLSDFIYRLFSANSKSRYFFRNWGWADLLASLPVQQLKVFRIFRIVRVVRLMRIFGTKRMIFEIRDNRAGSALYLTVFLVILVLESAAIAIIYVERGHPDANIVTASDAIWWGYVTITTVGYGDRYPVTHNGRFVGFLLLTAGVTLFGVLTGYLANAFLSPRELQDPDIDEEEELLSEQIKSFKKLVAEQSEANAALLVRLNKLENQLVQQETPASKLDAEQNKLA